MGSHDYYTLLLYNTNDIYLINDYVAYLNYKKDIECII